MFLTQSASMIEVARTLGRRSHQAVRDHRGAARAPALAVGLSLALLEALNDIGASEYLGVRTFTVRCSRPGSTGAAFRARRRSRP